MKIPALITAVSIGALIYWMTRPKPVDAVVNPLPPANSGPVVNGLGNIFNQPWRAQQAYTGGRNQPGVVERRAAPQITRYARPTRPQFSTPLFFK